MSAVQESTLPRGDWSYELAWGGIRTLARLHDGDATLIEGHPERFAKVAHRVGRGLRVFDCVVDGELCALDRHGRPSRALLRRDGGTLTYFLFDLLELEGEPQLSRRLADRKLLLQSLLDPSEHTIRLSDGFADGPQLLELVGEQKLRGIVAKREASPYVPDARSGDSIEVPARGASARADPADLNSGEVELRRGKRAIRLTRLEYLWWLESGIRKVDLVDYYRQVSPVLLPHLRDAHSRSSAT